MEKLLVIAILCLLIGCSSSDKKKNKDTERQPNIVFILVDDLGWKDLGSYGSVYYDTPNIDSLASEGIRFTNAYAASPVCSPTRAAIMTGKHPARVNITDWIPGMPTKRAKNPKLIPPEDIHNLPLDEATVAEAFQKHDYRTFFAGKWHLGETPKYWPKKQGFDINVGGHDQGSPPGGYYSPYKNPRLEDGPKGEYLTDRLTEESIEFIKQSTENPFFLFLSFYTVHAPIQGCKRFNETYKQKKRQLRGQGKVVSRVEHHGKTRLNQSNYKYAAMVRCMDENVGKLMDTLKQLGEYKNTVIVFTSDNGGLTTRPTPGPTAVTPLRAGKGWLYEGGIRIPLIIKAPGISEDEVSDQPVTSMDLYPTLLELAGFPKQPKQHVDGISLVPYLNNPQRVDERTLVWHYPHYHGSTWRPGSAIRMNNWKLIQFYESNELELYNLGEDIGETYDLSKKMPQKTEKMYKKLKKWRQKIGAKVPTPVNTK